MHVCASGVMWEGQCAGDAAPKAKDAGEVERCVALLYRRRTVQLLQDGERGAENVQRRSGGHLLSRGFGHRRDTSRNHSIYQPEPGPNRSI